MSAETQLRVVIADDDAITRRVTRCALQEAGMSVVAEAMDGREAIRLSLRHGPDVVVIDAVLPRLDGILATRRILQANPGQPVVVLTGADEDELAEEALGAGAVDVVPKNADPGLLIRALGAATHDYAAIARAAS